MDFSIPKSAGPWKNTCSSILLHHTAKSLTVSNVRKWIGDSASTSFWAEILGRELYHKIFVPSVVPALKQHKWHGGVNGLLAWALVAMEIGLETSSQSS